MKYIITLTLFTSCASVDMVEQENKELKKQLNKMDKELQQREDEIEYIGHQLMDCQNQKK